MQSQNYILTQNTFCKRNNKKYSKEKEWVSEAQLRVIMVLAHRLSLPQIPGLNIIAILWHFYEHRTKEKS